LKIRQAYHQQAKNGSTQHRTLAKEYIEASDKAYAAYNMMREACAALSRDAFSNAENVSDTD